MPLTHALTYVLTHVLAHALMYALTHAQTHVLMHAANMVPGDALGRPAYYRTKQKCTYARTNERTNARKESGTHAHTLGCMCAHTRRPLPRSKRWPCTCLSLMCNIGACARVCMHVCTRVSAHVETHVSAHVETHTRTRMSV